MNAEIKLFTSQSELVSLCPERRHSNRGAMASVDRYRFDQSFLGCANHDEVDRLTSQGWEAGLARIKEVAAKISASIPRVKTSKRRTFRGQQGDELDIHSVRNGNMDRAWRYTKRIDIKGKGKSRKVRLVIGVGGNGARSADELFWSPAAALVVCEILVKARFAVEIYAASSSLGTLSDGPDRTSILVKIKNFEHPVNLSSLAILALAGWFRKYIFLARCSLPYSIDVSLGRTVRVTPEDLTSLPPAKTLIASMIYSEEEAIEWINKSLSEAVR